MKGTLFPALALARDFLLGVLVTRQPNLARNRKSVPPASENSWKLKLETRKETEIWKRETGTGNWKLETGNCTVETDIWYLEI